MDLNGRNGRKPGRTNRQDPLVSAVGWRLFRSDDIPGRMRRLRTMEETAERSPVPSPPKPATKS